MFVWVVARTVSSTTVSNGGGRTGCSVKPVKCQPASARPCSVSACTAETAVLAMHEKLPVGCLVIWHLASSICCSPERWMILLSTVSVLEHEQQEVSGLYRKMLLLQSEEGLPADCKTARQWECPDIPAHWILKLEPLDIYPGHRARTGQGDLYPESHLSLADEMIERPNRRRCLSISNQNYSGQYSVGDLNPNPWSTLPFSTRYLWRQWECERLPRTPPHRREALHLRLSGSAPLDLNILEMCFLSNAVKYSVGYASNGLYSHVSLGCSSFLCAGTPCRRNYHACQAIEQ
jgi:hypothetical protein